MASAVKLTPLALLPPIAGRRWRDGAVMGGVFVGAGALAWVVAPHESVQYWFHELLGGRYGHESLVGNQSLAGLLARHPLPGPPAFTTLVLVIAMAAILVVGSWRAVRLARRGAGLSAFVVASCTGLLLAPVSWTHHQTPVLLAALCASLSTERATALLRGLVVVVMCVNLSAVQLPILGTVLAESRLLLIAYLALLGRYQLLRPWSQHSTVGDDKERLQLLASSTTTAPPGPDTAARRR